ncbi:acyl-CoA dehydrogenase family protein [Gammaproteobacteria bacterium]|nr:acyl-CoA dehydrogenase family protein [Gammaproteobacteria bacterium]MDA7821821.1 acyl-CoA dehydrogenase family protein [Gammaproteobacteria bacterium]MDA8674456.1 acyl-CoA dehydrogenase family protein [Gammaproteobacteria bacterium]MDA8926314.1 acyl-CoA dehydrogenase family protein [Gammaproteobacteria bacterium]MDB0066033.1 acyl-CoA dehydrogenase family protein [Gammaproteobacteria bacterium]|tara:strand:- start:3078 stop:4217 length:1140 start_codon:yes stop_codon:yes gene_type:complete
MKLILNEEQQFLKDTAKNFAEERTPINHFRSLRDNKDNLLWDKDTWKEMVNLGWSGILIPEEYGGSNFGLAGISVILQECGKTLTPSPLFATGVLGAYAISQYGTEEQKKKYLPQIVNGEITTAIAIDESSHHNPLNINMPAVLKDNSYILNGKKVFVVDGASADLLIVVARTSGKTGDSTGLTLFLVENNQPSINVVKLDMADSRNYANITFSDITVQKENILGDVEAGGEAIENILDIGRIAISAEMLGNTEAAFESTISYLKERKQFGVLIGTFQALQHRAAEMFCEIELTKSSIMAAMQGADNNSNELQRLASLAKTMAGETLHLVSNEAIQMHGGIGVTDEYDLGFYLKRSRVVEQIFGCSKFHTERYANISGF